MFISSSIPCNRRNRRMILLRVIERQTPAQVAELLPASRGVFCFLLRGKILFAAGRFVLAAVFSWSARGKCAPAGLARRGAARGRQAGDRGHNRPRKSLLIRLLQPG